MNYGDVQRVNQLVNEKQAIQRAIANFDAGGRIVSMSIAQPQNGGAFPVPLAAAATVTTNYIEYPPQMVTAIKAALDGRVKAIEAELNQLGITGIPAFDRPPAMRPTDGR